MLVIDDSMDAPSVEPLQITTYNTTKIDENRHQLKREQLCKVFEEKMTHEVNDQTVSAIFISLID